MGEEKKFTILLAEDDKFISRAYNDGLSRNGFNVVLAQDGNEAVKFAKEKRPDIILLDLIMPDKNGFEALKEIKADEKTKQIPVIILSNLGQDTDIKKGKEMGAVDYLIKANFSMSEVIEKIRGYLAKK
ncbi:response regulator [Candidatus Falkowbacteria bacterium]|nr:MAG: response regulator [Candidatus Falkowbacteria bacterium]